MSSSFQHRATARRTALLRERAAGMRAALTPSEAALWQALRGRQLGVAFRRQVVIGGAFIADFAAPAARLVVEVDGGYHAERRGADARRDRELRRLGWRVVRLPARLVAERLAEAVALVRGALG
jgi:very-short-patch-repair endonuclease